MKDNTTKRLNSFLRNELSAVDTYRQALARVQAPGAKSDLSRCLASHEARVRELVKKITELGGEPVTGSGVRGFFAKITEGGAVALGERAAIAALEDGEDRARDEYRRGIDAFENDLPLRAFVDHLLAEQLQTHSIMSSLQRSLRDKEAHPRSV